MLRPKSAPSAKPEPDHEQKREGYSVRHECKRVLRRLLPRRSELIEEALCVSNHGRKLFAVVQQHDFEEIVAKRKDDAYVSRVAANQSDLASSAHWHCCEAL